MTELTVTTKPKTFFVRLDSTTLQKGDKGDTGEAGTPGSVWHLVSGVPENSLGVDGDFALDQNSAEKNFYHKDSGAWGLAGSLASGGGGGVTDLSMSRDLVAVTILSSTGNDAVIPAADGTAAGVMTKALFDKLAGIASGATANDTDANLRDRSTHTGTQPASSISDFDAEVANNVEVAANTALRQAPEFADSVFRVIDGTDGTKKARFQAGSISTATLRTFTFPDQDGTLSLDGHTHTAADVSDFDAEVSNNTDVAANTAARHTHSNASDLDLIDFSGIAAGDIIAYDGISVIGRDPDFSDSAFTIYDEGDNTKQAQFQASGLSAGVTRTFTFPDQSGTIALNGHTHTAADVSDFDAEVSNNTDVAANTAARHTHSNASDLDLLNLAGISDGDILQYNSGTGDVEPVAGGLMEATVGALTQAATATITVDAGYLFFLRSLTLTSATDVTIALSGSPKGGSVQVYNNSGATRTITLPTGHYPLEGEVNISAAGEIDIPDGEYWELHFVDLIRPSWHAVKIADTAFT